MVCNAANSSKDDFKDVPIVIYNVLSQQTNFHDNDGNEEEDDDDDEEEHGDDGDAEEEDGNEENAQFAEVSVLGCSPQLSTSTEKE